MFQDGPGSIATTTACLTHLRSFLQDETDTALDQGIYVLVLGAAGPDPAFKNNAFHDAAHWKQQVAGRLMAAGRIAKLMTTTAAARALILFFLVLNWNLYFFSC